MRVLAAAPAPLPAAAEAAAGNWQVTTRVFGAGASGHEAAQAQAAAGMMLFETDGGRVTHCRMGAIPTVRHVNGCNDASRTVP